ncbi:fibronectin type III domain-containing protein [Roseivirga sp. BDSF3-8]|uniref:fibronectin type III domain-containing protein n=1 Tax=Roseivirga sp. BDSF3-8 TaxID=3241598 RepID=UPI0035319780
MSYFGLRGSAFKWFIWVLAGLLLSFTVAHAQSAVQASLQVFPPHSVYLSHYSQPGSLQVQLLLRDLSEPSYPVQLRWTIEGPGIRISTRQGYQGNVITLQGGMPRLLSAPELAGGLSPDALDFSGYDRGQFAQSGGQLPEGFYRFTVQAYDFRRPDVPLSAPATATAWLVLADPPLLNLPACNSQVNWQPGQPLLFHWTPMHRGSGLSGIAYEFTLVEVRGGLPPEEAMRTLPPLYQTVTRQTSLTYGLELPPLQEGITYAWRVRAQLDDRTGSPLNSSSGDLFKNQGYSRICAFVPGTPVADLPPLSDLTAEALSHVHAKFSFAGYHRDNRRSQTTTYRLQYRPTHQPDWPWRSVDITDTVYIARELAPDTPYEVKAGVVRNGIASQWSQVTPFTTQAPPEQACYDDEGPLPEITNREPLPNALVGDQIAVGKFTMRLQEVRGGDGVFSGRGTIYVPWMGLTLPVQFDRIAINTDYRMTDGLVHALSKPLDEWREGIEEFWEDRQQLADTTITVSGYLEAVTIKKQEGQEDAEEEITEGPRTYVVTLASGETIEIQQPPGQSVAVTDSQGRTIVIDEEGRIGPILEPEADTPVLATGDRISQPVYFTAYDNQIYGFDTQLHDAYTEHYESLPLSEDENSEYPIAWKALATGQTDRVILKGDTTGLKLYTETGQPVPVLEKTGDDLYTILLTGQGDKEESYLQAIRTNAEDSTESLSGKLNTVSYTPEHLTLKVVPVNGAGYMKPGRGTDISQALKKTYGPAVVNWTVIYEKAFTADYDTDGDGALDDGSTGMLSNYTPEMRKLIRSYEQAHKTAEGTYYLFLVHTPKSAIDEDGTDNARAGFMPYKRQFGFIFTSRIGNSDHFDKTIAHELGHGAFRLQHTFVETPALEEWATDNLMDYTFFGTQLHKHQWDLIHNPRPVWGLLTDDEEVSAYSKVREEYVIELINSYYCARDNGERAFPFYHYEDPAKFWAAPFKWFSGVADKSLLEGISIEDIQLPNTAYGLQYFDRSSIEYFHVGRQERHSVAEKGNVYTAPRYGVRFTSPGGGAIEIDTENKEQAEKLIQIFERTNTSYSNYIKGKVDAIKKLLTEEDEDEVFTILSSSPVCVYEEFAAVTRVELINLLLSEANTDITQETMLVKLLESVSDVETFVPLFEKDVDQIAMLRAIDDSDTRMGLLRAIIRIADLYHSPGKVAFIFSSQDESFSNHWQVSELGSHLHFELISSLSLHSPGPTHTLTLDTLNLRPFEMVGLRINHSHKDVGLSKGTVLESVPALLAAFIINKQEQEAQETVMSLALDITLLSVGIGEISAAYRAYQSSRTLRALFRLTLAVGDNLAAFTDIACQSTDTELCEKWKEVSFYIQIGLLSVSAADGIESLIRRTREVADNQLALYRHLDGIENQSLRNKIVSSGFDEATLSRLDDLLSDANILIRLEANPGLIEAWKVLEETRIDGLASKVDNLEIADDFVKKYPHKLDVFKITLKEAFDAEGILQSVKKFDEVLAISNSNDLIKVLENVTEVNTVMQLEQKGVKSLFRGTTRSKADGFLFPGNTNTQAGGISTSTDPVRATIFAIESTSANQSFRGVIQMGLPKDLGDLKLLAPNNRANIELEAILKISADDFSTLSKVEIAVDDARELVKEVFNIDLPNNIPDNTVSNELLESLDVSGLDKSLEFYQKAIKYSTK